MTTPVMLVPIDVTGCGWEVVATAADLAARLGSRVVLLGVVDPPSGVSMDESVVIGGSVRRVDDALVGEEKDLLRAFEAPFVDKGVQVRSEAWVGSVSATVLKAAEDHAAQHIVMGTHGRKGLARWVLGSVAEAVIREAPCPVTVVRTQHPELHPGPAPVRSQIDAEADG